MKQSINQSINQSMFYSTNIPGVARLTGATDPCSKAKSMNLFRHINSSSGSGDYAWKVKSKRYVLRRLLKVATEVAEYFNNKNNLKEYAWLVLTGDSMTRVGYGVLFE